jgi:hypothetical protein
MNQFLPDPIIEAEFAALQNVLASAPVRIIEQQIQERLI